MIDLSKVDFEELIRRLSFSDIDGVKYIRSDHLHKAFWRIYNNQTFWKSYYHYDMRCPSQTFQINELIDKIMIDLGYYIIYPGDEEVFQLYELEHITKTNKCPPESSDAKT